MFRVAKASLAATIVATKTFFTTLAQQDEVDPKLVAELNQIKAEFKERDEEAA